MKLSERISCWKALLQTDRSPAGGRGLQSPSPQLKLSSCRRPWPPDRLPADWILWSNSRDAMVCRKERSEIALVPSPTFPLRPSMQGCSAAAEHVIQTETEMLT